VERGERAVTSSHKKELRANLGDGGAFERASGVVNDRKPRGVREMVGRFIKEFAIQKL
jgi:hypothetical protein